MLEAFLWGLFASSSLVVGGLLALRVSVSRLVLGLVMAFGAGVLISAVAFELVEDAFEESELLRDVAFGLFAGCAAFSIGDGLIDRFGGGDRKRMSGEQSSGSPLAIVLGIVLDGIPESAVIGLTLLEGGAVSVAMLVAVFLSNLPEAIAATTGLRQSGWRPLVVIELWVGVALVSALSALAGYAIFDGASPSVVAFVLAFAGGAILTMLADTMMPEAFAYGGKAVGLLTTLGFGVALWIVVIENAG
jgi:zinc transporter, ZIP family